MMSRAAFSSYLPPPDPAEDDGVPWENLPDIVTMLQECGVSEDRVLKLGIEIMAKGLDS